MNNNQQEAGCLFHTKTIISVMFSLSGNLRKLLLIPKAVGLNHHSIQLQNLNKPFLWRQSHAGLIWETAEEN